MSEALLMNELNSLEEWVEGINDFLLIKVIFVERTVPFAYLLL